MTTPQVIPEVERRLKIWLGVEHVYSDHKPKKEACEITVYMKVWGMNVRLDWEYEVPNDPKRQPDAEALVEEITKVLGEDIAGCWAAGPDRERLFNYLMYGNPEGKS